MVELVLQQAMMLVFLAVVTEAVTEAIKAGFPGAVQDKVTYFVSMAIGITLVFALNVNIFNLDGFGYYVTVVVTGIIVSRGSNYVHDFLYNLENPNKKE